MNETRNNISKQNIRQSILSTTISLRVQMYVVQLGIESFKHIFLSSCNRY